MCVIAMKSKQSGADNLLKNFRPIFYITKLLCIYPHDFAEFKNKNTLKKSQCGSMAVVLNMCITTTCFVLMVVFYENNTFTSDKDNLALVIGFVLTFIGVFAMVIDFLNIVRNQQELAQIFEQIDEIDIELRSYNIVIKNDIKIQRLMLAMIVLTVAYEGYGVGSTFFIVSGDFEWRDLLWVFSGMPTLFSTLDKVWFVGLILAIRERFEALNLALEGIVARHEQLINTKFQKKVRDQSLPTYDKINEHFKVKSGGSMNKVYPTPNSPDIYFGEMIDSPDVSTIGKPFAMSVDTELTDVNTITEKFIRFCQLHDTICGIAKTLNEVWSFSMLILMGFGFIITTGYLYFLYCASQQQPIPSLFNSAQSFMVTTVYIMYISGRCIVPMFVSWKTSLAAKRTGVCLHKCAVAADINEIYEIVNHLSLRLINHAVDFSAFGYFTLDMTTLYGFIGGITSYLIILIQFNMAGNQVKTANSMATSLAYTNATKSMALMYENSTMLIDFLLNWSQMSM